MSVVIGLESYPTGWGEVGLHEGQRTLELRRRRHLATNRGPLVATGDTRVQVGPTLVGARLRRRPSRRRVLHSERLYGWPNRSRLNNSAAAVEGGVKGNSHMISPDRTRLISILLSNSRLPGHLSPDLWHSMLIILILLIHATTRQQ